MVRRIGSAPFGFITLYKMRGCVQRSWWRRLGFVLALFTVPVCADVNLQLSYTDMNGNKLKAVGTGTPFSIALTIRGDEQINAQPKIRNLDKFFYASGSSQSSMHVVNGKMTSSQTTHYQVRIDRPGTVTIGPATISHNGKTYQSNVLTINVAARETPAQARAPEAAQALLMLSLSKQRAYVHEGVSLKIRFYYRGDVHGMKAQMPEIPHADIHEAHHTGSGTEILNDKEWQYQEWLLRLFPKKTGRLSIPKAVFAYQVIREHSPSSARGMLAMLMGPELVDKKVVSNAVSLEVLPLPRPVKSSFVGTFSNYSASVNQQAAMEGDAIVMTLRVTGNGNMNAVKLEPHQLPDGMKSYHSRTRVVPEKQKGVSTVTSEYVLQGTSVGKQTIPGQRFTYFDPRAKQYKTLKSPPISLTITERPETHVPPDEPNVFQDEGELGIRPFIIDQQYHHERAWPLWLFVALQVFMVGVTVALLGYQRWAAYQQAHYMRIRKERAFKKAVAELAQLEKADVPSGLYSLFVEYISARLEMPANELTSDMILDALGSRMKSQEGIAEWKHFWHAVNSEAFGETTLKTHHPKILFEEAHQWLKRLGELL